MLAQLSKGSPNLRTARLPLQEVRIIAVDYGTQIRRMLCGNQYRIPLRTNCLLQRHQESVCLSQVPRIVSQKGKAV